MGVMLNWYSNCLLIDWLGCSIYSLYILKWYAPRTVLDGRAFAVAGPRTLNSLPVRVRSALSLYIQETFEDLCVPLWL